MYTNAKNMRGKEGNRGSNVYKKKNGYGSDECVSRTRELAMAEATGIPILGRHQKTNLLQCTKMLSSELPGPIATQRRMSA